MPLLTRLPGETESDYADRALAAHDSASRDPGCDQRALRRAAPLVEELPAQVRRLRAGAGGAPEVAWVAGEICRLVELARVAGDRQRARREAQQAERAAARAAAGNPSGRTATPGRTPAQRAAESVRRGEIEQRRRNTLATLAAECAAEVAEVKRRYAARMEDANAAARAERLAADVL